MNVREAVIVAYGRTTCAKAKKGHFKDTSPVEFGGQCLLEVIKKIPQLNTEEIDDVIVGCSFPMGVQSNNMGRLIAKRADMPDKVSAQTLTRFCASGLTSIAAAANAIMCGQQDVVVAGGVESLTHVSMAFDNRDPWIAENIPALYIPMGLTAENVASRYGISREDMDMFALESHRRAAIAQASKSFDDQIVPVAVVKDGKPIIPFRDEGIRPDCSLETLAAMEPCFKSDGLVTAATSSQMMDGAAFLVLMSAEKAKKLDLKPIASFVSYATAGVPAEVMGIGPVEAVPKVMRKAGLTVGDMDVIELNEAFASQALYCIRALGLDAKRVNPHGGAIAMGHPLGATGAVLTCKALSYLRSAGGSHALVTMCVGGGMGNAAIFKMYG
ncbi:MAG: thiolase family protein [Clostridiales Family XIII bacterium]|jgi:acetyl-CoA acyltransferase|nr:thiolase family protein [Clostridiales Family XIII bacterium]